MNDSQAPARITRRRPRQRKRIGGRNDRQVRRFALDAARLLADFHCTQILLLDVRDKSDVTDYVLLASGTSDRQIRSVAEDVRDLARQQGLVALGQETDTRTSWVVVDLADVVVHLFEPATRAHYDLEMMWGDAHRIRWRRKKG